MRSLRSILCGLVAIAGFPGIAAAATLDVADAAAYTAAHRAMVVALREDLQARGSAANVQSELVRHGRVRRAYIGIAAQQFALSRRRRHAAGLAQESAVMIATVEPDSPAARAGLAAGDIILALDGTTVTGADDLIRNLAGDKIARRVEIEALRNGSRIVVSLVPDERPHRS